ncbi:hypothetical protein GIY62_21060 [Burkholderia plantarii]|uniref:hypothetical protein n=1 Tax=Burkholderia plantarii TaxID=41899 RepID=UPI00272D48B8|nr:hypothetical protein [Burkholderia plantarii]WLE64087.1 hypothetical protein GIY62_21060 [Burkholderia plantarii]
MSYATQAPLVPRRHPLLRLVAIVAFVAGGFATEIAHPFACTTLVARGPAAARRRDRDAEGVGNGDARA